MQPNSFARFQKWRNEAEARGRVVLAACCVNFGLTFTRHCQTVEFDVRLDASNKPEFFCVYPVRTVIRGEIGRWVWEPTVDGKTRLWVPTELVWRAVFVGDVIGKIVPLDGKLTGSGGLEIYRRPDCWWVSFLSREILQGCGDSNQ